MCDNPGLTCVYSFYCQIQCVQPCCKAGQCGRAEEQASHHIHSSPKETQLHSFHFSWCPWAFNPDPGSHFCIQAPYQQAHEDISPLQNHKISEFPLQLMQIP